MVKVDRDKKLRIVKYTKTQPPVTFSYFKKVPRIIRHHIDGNLELTYKPYLLDDLVTKVTYDLSEDEDEIRLVDPGGSKAKSQEIQKEEKRKRELLEQHSNGEMTEKGFPKGESIAVVPDFKERAQKGLPIIMVAEKKKEEHTGEGSEIFDEKTEPFEEVLEKHHDYWNHQDEHLDYEPEYKESEVTTRSSFRGQTRTHLQNKGEKRTIKRSKH